MEFAMRICSVAIATLIGCHVTCDVTECHVTSW